MTPVTQSLVGSERGNCVAACWASLLDCEIGDIPEMTQVRNQFEAEVRFAARLGLAITSVPRAVGASYSWDCDVASGAIYMACGVSPRGISHRVLMRDGKLVHDPHPDGGGIGEPDRIVIVFGDLALAAWILRSIRLVVA